MLNDVITSIYAEFTHYCDKYLSSPLQAVRLQPANELKPVKVLTVNGCCSYQHVVAILPCGQTTCHHIHTSMT